MPENSAGKCARTASTGWTQLYIHDMDAPADALRAGNLPCTVEHLTEQFNDRLRQAMSGHDRRNTKLTLT